MRIAVSFAVEVPDSGLPALFELAAVEPGDRAGARVFVQAEAEQHVIDYLGDCGVVPIRGVALPADYPTRASAPYPTEVPRG